MNPLQRIEQIEQVILLILHTLLDHKISADAPHQQIADAVQGLQPKLDPAKEE